MNPAARSAGESEVETVNDRICPLTPKKPSVAVDEIETIGARFAVSLSASVAVTLTAASPVDVTSNTAEPFVRSASSAAASVTVCGVSQLAVVNVRAAPPLSDRSVSPEM